jgi:hypothetical protein
MTNTLLSHVTRDIRGSCEANTNARYEDLERRTASLRDIFLPPRGALLEPPVDTRVIMTRCVYDACKIFCIGVSECVRLLLFTLSRVPPPLQHEKRSNAHYSRLLTHDR